MIDVLCNYQEHGASFDADFLEEMKFRLHCFAFQAALLWYSHAKGRADICFLQQWSVAKNTMNVESTLNKKHSSVAYHHCRWSVEEGIITIAHISTHK
jgi:hypothetical protein